MSTSNFNSFWVDHNIWHRHQHEKYFAFSLNYHMVGSTKLISNKVDWLAVQNREAPEFNTLEQRLYKVRGDSAENKLDPV